MSPLAVRASVGQCPHEPYRANVGQCPREPYALASDSVPVSRTALTRILHLLIFESLSVGEKSFWFRRQAFFRFSRRRPPYPRGKFLVTKQATFYCDAC